jgi:hypothetical protein
MSAWLSVSCSTARMLRLTPVEASGIAVDSGYLGVAGVSVDV